MNLLTNNKSIQINKQIIKINRKIKNLNKQLQTIPTTKQWNECLLGIERVTYQYSQLSTHTPNHELWLLIQHALQSGPFINSKPGYFKRAHIHFIKRANTFIDNIKSHSLSFTENQNNRLAEWSMNAKNLLQKQNTNLTTQLSPLQTYVEKVGNKKKIPKIKMIKNTRKQKKIQENKK